MILRAIERWVLVLSLLFPTAALAQTSGATPPTDGDQLLKPAELDALVAPIALYPDPLLAQVLMASTYPLEVVQADRWISENKKLKADALKSEVEKQGWDDSVKGLVATPSVLSMMSSKLDWTQKLGDAVLAQQPDVMDAIQRLRARAQANNKLQSTKQQKVIVTQEADRQLIAIEPADPGMIYVPYYDPAVVYGGWPYPDHPPYYWGYPGYIGAGLIATGLAFGAGYALGRWASGGRYWGRGSFDWNRNNINIGSGNRVTHWQHNPQHRQGVRYNNRDVAQRFGNNSLRQGAQNRMDFRGRGGQQVLNPGGGNVADRRNPGDRGSGNRQAGNRPADRQAGNRASGDRAADRPSNRQAAHRSGSNRQAGNRPAGNRQAGSRGGGGGAQRAAARGGGNAFANIQRGSAARAQASRGMASLGGPRFASGGGARLGGGGGGGGGFRGGGRRSDIALKHDIVLLGHLDNGLGFYRFSYIGSDKAYVGVMAQEVQAVMPQAVTRGSDGYLRVFYDKLGLTFETYEDWRKSGAHVPPGMRSH
ncbi:MAG TPA: DUF3300 domain-containing protein [Xanthobacteraceae bacterium]|nr:DUF3300 domain-containing protein [Xanthobacteraceae bacterium]